MKRLFVLFTLMAAALFGQSVTDQPKYFATVGGTYDYTGKSAAGLAGFGIKIADKTYSLTTATFAPYEGSFKYATQTGVARIVFQFGDFTVLALSDAGVVKTNTALLGAFSGGGSVAFDIGKALHKADLYLNISEKMTAISDTQLKPVLAFSLSKTF